MANVSGAIRHIQNVKKQVARSMDLSYSASHTKPDLAPPVWKIADIIRTKMLQKLMPDRDENIACKLMKDLRAIGYKILESSTLATFNKKMRIFIAGNMFEAEEDELPRADFGETVDPSTEG